MYECKMTDDKSSRTLESLLATAVTAHEMVRRRLRTVEAKLPFSESVNEFYFKHAGDFMDGFLLSFFSNMMSKDVTSYVAGYVDYKLGRDNLLYKIADYIDNNENVRTLLSGAVGIAGVVVAETVGIANTPDPNDIPAGIAGALTYMAARYYVTRRHEMNTQIHI